MERLSPREQGDLGERSAACWLLEHGYSVFVPMGHSPDFDLIAYDGGDGGLLRVQVKTSTQRHNNRRWCVTQFEVEPGQPLSAKAAA